MASIDHSSTNRYKTVQVQVAISKKAFMDVSYQVPQGVMDIDVRICSPCAGDDTRVRAAAKTDGEAGARQVTVKKSRYGPDVFPFICETGGRPTKEAMDWVKDVVKNSMLDIPIAIAGARIWARFSCTLQRCIATQLRKAEGLS